MALVEPTDRPCEDCGSVVVSGLEPVEPARWADEGGPAVGSEWCTNLDCRSNRQRDLHRVGVNEYVCQVCGEVLRTPVSAVFAHRQAHRRTES
jgi:hypothetical protein